MKVFKIIIFSLIEALSAVKYFLSDSIDYFLYDDMSVMSRNCRKIFSNKSDRKIYTNAVEELRKRGGGEKTITLETVGTITIMI